MGTKRIFRGHGRRHRLVELTDILVYVPLLKTIETLLKDEGIYTEVCHLILILESTSIMCIFKVKNGHTCTIPGKLADYCDGTIFSTHPLFKAKQTALQICLYYDDVEVCNPLGSSRGKHKLGIQ